MKKFLRRASRGVVIVLLFLAGGEFTSRLDDDIHLGVPFFASPDNERDLKLREAWGFRGRPHGLFRKWRLNRFGFRGPEMEQQPQVGTTRVLVLGASETFGLLESQGKEYPAQLRVLLAQHGPYEVINGGVTSLTASAMTPYWQNWAQNFRPQIVLIYPSPIFYLRDDAPGPLSPPTATEANGPYGRFQFRLFDRALSLYRSLPLSIRTLRRQWQLRQHVAGREEAWFFSSVPDERLDLYGQDVKSIVDSIRQSGSVPVLVTHAISAQSPPRAEDQLRLQDMRADFCRPTIEVMAEFEKRANALVRDIARREGVPFIDAAAELGGQSQLYGDLVHFNDAGAARLARLLAEGVLRETAAAANPTRSTADQDSVNIHPEP